MTGVVEDDEIDLGEVLLTWLAQWPLITASAVGGLIMAGAYAFVFAPEEYEASAMLRAVPHQFCPAVAAPCSVEIKAALEDAAAAAVLPAAVEALETDLGLLGDPFLALDDRPATPNSVSLRLAETVRIDVAGTGGTVTVEHSDETRAVTLANAIAGYMQNELAAVSAREMAEAEAAARRQLSSLPAPSQLVGQSEAMIAIERSTIAARLEGIAGAREAAILPAEIVRPAALPGERTAPRYSLLLALGALLGLFGGLGAALIRARRSGTLHSVSAIREAFRQAGLPVKALVRLEARRSSLGWQEALLALEPEARITAVVAATADRRVREAAFGFIEAAVPKAVTVLDLAGWFEQASPTDPAKRVRDARSAELPQVLSEFGPGNGHVFLLAPRAERDLAGLAQSLDAADSVIVVTQPGHISRGDVERVSLASRGRLGSWVLVAI